MNDGAGVPDFSDPNPLGGISMQVLLHLEKVGQGIEPWTNMCAAYRLVFGADPDITRPADDIMAELMAAMSAMSPDVEIQRPGPPPPPKRPRTISEAMRLPSTGQISGEHEMFPTDLVAKATVDPTKPKISTVWVWIVLVVVAYFAGARRAADDWGDLGMTMIAMWCYVGILTMWSLISSKRKKR